MGVKQLSIRSFEVRDESVLLQWRNDPDSILWSRSRRAVASEEHARWFESALSNPFTQIFIGFYPNSETENVPEDSVGMVRFEWETEAWHVSIYVRPLARGQGVASELLGMGIKLLSHVSNKGTNLIAYVHESNTPSKQLFLSNGFRFDGQDGDFLRLKMSPQASSET